MGKKLLLFLCLWVWGMNAAGAPTQKIASPAARQVKAAGKEKPAMIQNENLDNQLTKKKASQWLDDDLPGFVENKGQLVDQNGKSNSEVKYLLTMPGLNVQLRQTGFSYDTYVKTKGDTEESKFHRVDIELDGSSPMATLSGSAGSAPLTNSVNQNGEFSDIRKFGKVTYKEIYPGIDLEFIARKGADKPVEYNFIVHPGADASLIRLNYKGADDVALQAGKIVMRLHHGKLSESIPASWLDKNKKSIKVGYKALKGDVFAFQVPAYDKTQTLVIDPTPNLVWSTYYGGSENDLITGVDTDPSGNIYVSGRTSSASNIASAGAYDGVFGGAALMDIFVVKFNSAGQRLWGTYYGGADADVAHGITYHGGQVYVSGASASEGMATIGAHRTVNSLSEALLVRFDATTGQRNWATYYGARACYFETVRIDADGNIFALGGALVNTYPMDICLGGDVATSGAFKTEGGCMTAFLVKFNASGERQWGTFLVGALTRSVTTVSGLSMELDTTGNIYVAGVSHANATTDAAFAANVGEGTTPADGFIAKFGNDGSRLWARYFAGNITGVQLDEVGSRLYVVGNTSSTTGVASSGAYKTSLAATRDGFMASFDLAGHYKYGTYLGGLTGSTYATDCRLDNAGGLVILGWTTVTGNELATNCSYQLNPGGGQDGFLTKFSIADGQRVWGTYFGGAGDDYSGSQGGVFGRSPAPSSLALTADGEIVFGMISAATSTGLSTIDAHQSSRGGGIDGVLAKLNSGEFLADITLTPSVLSPMSQQTCILGIPAVITGNVVGVTAPVGYYPKIYYQWQQSSSTSGPWQDIPGEVFKDLQPNAAQTATHYRRQAKINTQFCTFTTVATSEVATVNVGTAFSPIANANGPQWYVCGTGNNTITLNGNATAGSGSYTYKWFEGSATAEAASSATYTPTVTSPTTYTLRVEDTNGCVDIDQVTVVPAIANAGADKAFCNGSGGVQLGTDPIASPDISYSWSVVSGTLNSLSCTTCAQPIASPTAVTTYELTVSVTRKGGTTCTSTDRVIVTPVAAPNGTVEFAGTNKIICKNSTVTLGGANDATFAYTWTSGQYLSASKVYNPVFDARTEAVNCSVNYTVTAIKNGCSFVDEVKVTVINPAITFQDETKCGPLWIDQADGANCAATTYEWSVVSGTGSVLQTRRTGSSAYLSSPNGVTRFRRTLTLSGVQCSADVLVQSCTTGGCDFVISTIGNQGCPKIFPSAPSFQLTTGLSASEYNFTWAPANMVDNPHAAVVTVTSASNSVITVTVTNKFDPSSTCTKSKQVNDPTWSLPIFNVEDKFACRDVGISIGSTANSGFSYNWSPAKGLNDITSNDPVATLASSCTYTVDIKETASGCKTSNSLTVTVSNVSANAGNDRAVCNGATITLGTEAPVGTNYTYSWTPVNGAYTNGTGPTDAQPQVLFASSSQTFDLTVTDPASGCTKTDQVTLGNSVVVGEYAGASVSACPNEVVELGRVVEPNATYSWTKSDGTVAVGLSCSDCANPSLTVPNVTTSYRVRVNYQGCFTPIDDIVTVTVKEAPVFALIDQSYCPSSALAIGFGASGNPAVPANVASYLWEPSTGLSSIAVANPTTTVRAETTYKVTVTYTNGCKQSDEVKITPNTVADAGPDMAVCLGESAEIGTAMVSGDTYIWTGAGITSGANTARPTVKPTITTTYTVSVTKSECTATDEVIVNVNTPSDFSLAGNTAICEGSSAVIGFSGTLPSNTTWQWSPVEGVADPNSPNTSIQATTTKTYRLTKTSLITGCSNYKEVVLVVNPNTISSTVSNVSLCEGVATSLPLTLNSTGNYSYSWSPAIGLSNAFIANPTITTSVGRAYTVMITDNVSNCQLARSMEVIVKPEIECLPQVTLVGTVFYDVNELKDASVNSTSPMVIPSGLYLTLVNSNGDPVKTVSVGSNGAYNFGITPVGDYRIVLHQTSGGAVVPSLPGGWVNTGENRSIGIGNDGEVNGILTDVEVRGVNVTNANFGIQQPPVTEDNELPSQVNPQGTSTVDISESFISRDPDGTVSTITFTKFPDNVTSISINGTVYESADWPANGVTVPITDLEVLIDPIDGTTTAEIPFKVADNGGAESDESTVTVPFTSPVTLSGKIFHDANGLKDDTVNSSGSVTTIPADLYATLVDELGNIVSGKTVAVATDGSYSFGIISAGSYSVVLHQAATPSLIPNLPTGWVNTGESLGTAAGNDGSVTPSNLGNGVLTGIVVATTDVSDANFGIQTPPVAEAKSYVIDPPALGSIIRLDGSLVSIKPGTSSPGQLTGNDLEDGELNGENNNHTVVITTLPDNGIMYYNDQPVVEGQVITNYDQALTTVEVDGINYTRITFQYAYVDEAGAVSPSVDYSISWDSTLPVTLVSFTARLRETSTYLAWKTTTEINSKVFDVERSADGKVWTRLGEVQALGESRVANDYFYLDSEPMEGSNLYRLKMIDRDGSFAYSRLVGVRLDSGFETSIYPNPVNETVNVKVSDWSKVKTVSIDNLLGIQVYSSGSGKPATIEIGHLPEGMYILRIVNQDGSVYTHKLVHVK